MCCKLVCLIVIASFLLFTTVKGSCLEYGHSCWGAHGKRSGGSGGKSTDETSKLRTRDNDRNSLKESNKDIFRSINDLDNQLKRGAILRFSDDDSGGVDTLKTHDVTKIRNLFRHQNSKFRDPSPLTADDSLEQPEALNDRWQKFTIFNRKPSTKPQRGNSENELLQQPSKPLEIDESFYYDFP